MYNGRMPVNAKQILAAVALTVLGTLACEMLAELYERRFHPEDYETASEPAPAQAEEPGPTEIEEADSPLVMEFTVNGEARELAVHKVKETFFTYRTDETPLTSESFRAKPSACAGVTPSARKTSACMLLRIYSPVLVSKIVQK